MQIDTARLPHCREKVLEVNSIDETIEVLIKYEEKRLAASIVRSTEQAAYEGLDRMITEM